jgi:nitrous oxide reductase accessory protein NosL
MEGVVRKLVLLVAALVVLGSTFAQAKDDVRCETCGMKWTQSTTRITAELNGTGSHKFESIGCLFQAVDSAAEVTRFKIVNYATIKSESWQQLDGKSAHYLFGTSKLKGSMAPFTAAFASKQAALAAQKELGGEYVTFEQVWSKLAARYKKKGGK